jgi:FkbM family methyltransferase
LSAHDRHAALLALAPYFPAGATGRESWLALLSRAARGVPSGSGRAVWKAPWGITLAADLADRYARDLAHGLIHEEWDLALFRVVAAGAREVWDIGANLGLYTVSARQVMAAEGRVIAVEPHPGMLDLLRANVATNGMAETVVVAPVALSATSGRVSFTIASDAAFSGLHDTGRSPVSEVIEVECRRFDDLWRENGSRPIDAVKMDVEGHETEVLESAVEALAASPDVVLMLEASPKNLDEAGNAAFVRVLESLRERGFDIFRLLADGTAEQLRDGGTILDYSGNLFLVRPESRLRPAIDAFLAAPVPLATPAPMPSPLRHGVEAVLDLAAEVMAMAANATAGKQAMERHSGEQSSEVARLRVVKKELETRMQAAAEQQATRTAAMEHHTGELSHELIRLRTVKKELEARMKAIAAEQAARSASLGEMKQLLAKHVERETALQAKLTSRSEELGARGSALAELKQLLAKHVEREAGLQAKLKSQGEELAARGAALTELQETLAKRNATKALLEAKIRDQAVKLGARAEALNELQRRLGIKEPALEPAPKQPDVA